MTMEQTQVDPQHVVNSLMRQIADLAGKVAMLEALLEQQKAPAKEE